ncbi:ATP synthase F(0) complex subunit B1, mitochondrial [Podarcis lilfordi]|uniref:ATP synthase subunit b n=1 Tax=Podarcis lilfordi TaxID=74358 RepID=A0AA35KRY9_9SAUR|nr:ATP synthase F(0) complex subunit B1, mitochondrial [Podarcis lilfordi]
MKKYGADVAAFADKLNEDTIAQATSVKNTMIADHTTAIEEKKEQWRVEGHHYLFDTKPNNFVSSIMLETNYRERLFTVYTEVKKQLDYHVAIQHLKRNMEQNHMINWVEQNLRQSITAQQEEGSIAKCILDLKALSKSPQATV